MLSPFVRALLETTDLIDHQNTVAETLRTADLQTNVRAYLETEFDSCEVEIGYRAALVALVAGES